ncbi:MAG: PAS domain-containing protein [Verrucomicrobia bacterium]|nr:PAS domain-containing protein [Verrucomicrobiota bacterium]
MWFYLTLLCLVALALLHFWWRKRLAMERAKFEKQLAELTTNQQRALSQFSTEQQVLFNSMVEGVLLLDQQHRIRLANRAFRELFGIREEVQGKTILETLRSHEMDDVVERVAVEGHVLGLELQPPGLQECVLQVNASAVNDVLGKQQGTILVFHDLTQLKKLERTRQEFVANVSHELRTPLSLIKGYVETLIDGAKNDPELATKFLGTIEKHADRLTFLIEDLLIISQLESGQIVLNQQRVNLHELSARVLGDLASRKQEKGVQITSAIGPDIFVQADAQRLEQVLCNLVDNAIKYGRQNGSIALNAKQFNEEQIVVSIKDDGPGIPPEAQERIFERFYRVDKARSREQGGTGLGLSIVKHIVQSHGGRVWVESDPGKGSTFYFSLPKTQSCPGARLCPKDQPQQVRH